MKNSNAIILLFTANIISGLAQGISMIAIPWYFVEIIDKQNYFTNSYLIITFLTLFWGLYAGTIIDRYSRKKIFINLNLICGSFIGLIALYGIYNQNISDIFVIAIFMLTIFNYNIHYPGPDGKFGPRHLDLVDDGEGEYIGLDWAHPDSKDDIVLQDELILEVGKPVLIYLTSKDVIHSLFLPEFRVKQDAIPGQKVAIFFTPEKTTEDFFEELNESEDFVLWDWISDPENYDYEFLDFNKDGTAENFSAQRGEMFVEKYGRDTFQLGCAQLCGSGHSAMAKGDMFIVSTEDYQKWYFGQMWAKNSIIVEDDEWGDDDW